MTQKLINVGIADKGNGDKLRDAFIKINDNFTDLYSVDSATQYYLGDEEIFISLDPEAGEIIIQSKYDSGMPIYIKGANCTDGGVGGNVVIEAGGPPLGDLITGTVGNVEIAAQQVTIESNNNIWTFRDDGVLELPNGTNIYGIGKLQIDAVGGFEFNSFTDTQGSNQQTWTFRDDGSLGFPAGYILPNTIGEPGQVMVAGGQGSISWQNQTGGTGGGLSISDFGLGFTNTLDAGKITTNKLYNRPSNLALNNHFELSVTDGGVVSLPDGSIINGATLKTVPGNYAGITAGPVGKDEDSWVYVDNDGAWIATKYSTDAFTWHFDNTGTLTLPNGLLGDVYGGPLLSSNANKPVTIWTDNGMWGWEFGADGILRIQTYGEIAVEDDLGVRIGSFSTTVSPNSQIKIGGADHAFEIFGGPPGYSWQFGTDGKLTFPDSATLAVGDIGVLQDLELAYDNSREQLNAAFAADSYEGDGWPAGPNSYNALLLSTDPAIRPEWIPLAQSVQTAWLALGSALEPIYLDIQVAGHTWNFSNAGDFSVPGNKAIKGIDNLQLNVDGGGGKTAVVEIDGYNSKVLIKTTTPGAGISDDAWTFGDAGELTLPVGGIIQTLTTPQVGTRLTDIPGWIRADINAKTAGFWMDTTPQSLKDAMDATGLVGWRFNPDGTADYYTVLAAEYVEGNTILELTFDANLPLESAPYSVESPTYSTRLSSSITIIANENEWIFGTDGKLTFPDGFIIDTSTYTNTTMLFGAPNGEISTKNIVLSTGEITNTISIPGTVFDVATGEGTTDPVSISGKNGVGITAGADGLAHPQYHWTFGSNGILTFPGADGFRATFGSVEPVGDVLHSVNSLYLESEATVGLTSGADVADLENTYIVQEELFANLRDEDISISAPTIRPWAGMPSYEAYDLIMAYNEGVGLPLSGSLAPAAYSATQAYYIWQTARTNAGVLINVADKQWVFGVAGDLRVPGTISKTNILQLNSSGTGGGAGNTASVSIDGDNGRLLVRTSDSETNKDWIFGTNGSLTLPVGGDIVDSTGTSVLGTTSVIDGGDATTWATP
jgi:hypothetical protein